MLAALVAALKRVAPADAVEEMIAQLAIGWPVSASMFLNRLLMAISVIFVGHLNERRSSHESGDGGEGSDDGGGSTNERFAAAMLASTLANVTGNSVLVGLASAAATLSAQAVGAGARQQRRLGEILQRALLVLALACVPISVAWWNAEVQRDRSTLSSPRRIAVDDRPRQAARCGHDAHFFVTDEPTDPSPRRRRPSVE